MSLPCLRFARLAAREAPGPGLAVRTAQQRPQARYRD